jgi:hypothetical protein
MHVKKMRWLGLPAVVLPMIVGGIVLAGQSRDAARTEQTRLGGYVCPLTGDELPCPKCCPLNR